MGTGGNQVETVASASNEVEVQALALRGSGAPVPSSGRGLHGAGSRVPSDHRFDLLRAALRASGGIANGDDLGRLLEDHRLVDFVSLASLMDHDDVFGFGYRHAFWIPMFQFDLGDFSLRHGARQVAAEFAAVFDGWSLTGWFGRSHRALGGQRPADVLSATPASVVAAARADRLRMLA